MRVKLRDKYFRFAFTRLPKTHDGECCKNTRTINIKNTLKGERQLDVIIHELLHGCHWDLDETVIEETATHVARVLWKLGYRKSNHE